MNKSARPSPAARVLSWTLAALAAGLLLTSLRLPLWQMRMEAPQYRDEEALRIAVHPDRLQGDLKELKVLNQYIGVHVPPTLPQFRWLPGVLVGGAVLGLVACLLPAPARRWTLVLVVASLTAALGFAAVQARGQMRDIGHNRDRHTVLVGVRDFTPPFLGTSKIAQFEVSSRFGSGAWLIGGALCLLLGAAGVRTTKTERREPAEPELHSLAGVVAETHS